MPPDSSPPVSQGREGFRRRGFPQIEGYVIDREIGRGGMATVYRATQQSLQRQVAIKIMMQELDDASEMAQRFKKEGHILAQLLHQNIVTIYDVGITENDQLYLSIEYLSGGTLRERIRQGLSIESITYIVRCIAKALGCAHEKGVIHRDIKPSNIMFRHDDTPVLTDFGVARISGSNTVYTAVGSMVGSPGYMSPEQARGESATIQSDLYGLGVIFYEMLTGHSLYQADNPLAVMLKHLHDPVPNLPEEHAYLQPILHKLLAKKSADRYQNVNQFLNALDLIIPSDTGLQSRVNPSLNNQGIVEFISGQWQTLIKEKPHFQIFIGVIGAAILAMAVGYVLKPRTMAEHAQTQLESMKMVKQPPPLSREAEIAALLKQADVQLKTGLLTDEAEQNAETTYRRVLKLDRGNANALAGLENIANEYERLAQQHLDAGVPQDSLDQIRRGLAVAPGRDGLIRLRHMTEQQIAELRIKKMEKNREQEQQLQAQEFLMQAQVSFKEGLLEISLVHIEQGLLAVPNHRELLVLQEQVNAKINELQRQAEARQKTEEDEQQKLEVARQKAEQLERQKAETARRQAEEVERQKAEATQRRQEADQYLALAVNYQRSSQYTNSLQQIEKGLVLIPDHPELIKLRDEIRTQQMTEQKRQVEHTQRDQEIKILLKQAETQWKAKHLTEPVGNNTEATYRQILKLDADNSQAKAGLERIAQDYLQQARQRRNTGALPDSLALIDKGLAVILNQAELTQLRQDVSQGIAEVKARQQRDKEQQVQAEQLLMQAQSSVQEGQWEVSLAHIEQGLLAIPNHRELLALREQVKTKRAEQQRQVEVQQKAEAAERQKVEQAQQQAEAAQKKAVEEERLKVEQARQQAEVARKKTEEEERLKAEQAQQQAEVAQRRQEADQSLGQAMEAQKKGDYATGLQQLDRGLTLVPDHAELLRLREAMRAQQAAEQKQQAEQAKREQEIKSLLEKAEVHFKAKRLTTPAGNNAAEAYRQAIKLDAGNEQAQAGLARIAQDYLQQAKLRQSAGAFQESLGLIEKGLTVVPNQAELTQLQEEVRGQLAAEQQRQEQQRLERQQQEQQRKERQQLEQQQQDVKPQKDEQKKLEQQRQEQQRKEQRLEQKRLEEQRQQEQQRKEQQRSQQQQDQQQKEQRQQEKQQQEQQKKLEQQQQLEQQRKEQQRLEQQRQQDQQRKLEQQRQDQQPKEQKPTPTPPPETTKPRVFGTF